jgi:hypothetical protein
LKRHPFGLAGVVLAAVSIVCALGAASALAGPEKHAADHRGGTLKLL